MPLRLQLPLLLLCLANSRAALAQDIPLTDLARLEPRNALFEAGAYHGRTALKVTEKASESGEAFVAIKNLSFGNGAIDVDVAGAPAKNAFADARGFIGVMFRLQPGGSHFELIYIRPTNGRSADQLRRNHSTQYVSAPDWPWERLRKESPGVYESYADLVAGEWTHLRIVTHGTNASLYVGDVTEPCLVVHDLKLGDSKGSVALWIGPGTEGYFSNLTIRAEGDKGPQYGSDDTAGHYVQIPDGKIYYERYGDGGRPLVLLHGGEYGYIDEFGELIREMSKKRAVVAIATRGYGRSERGTVPLSHRQFAQDAAAVIGKIFPNGEKVDLLGFSEGAITSYIVASSHPEMIHRLIAISGSLGRYGETKESLEAPPLTPELMQKQVPDLVAARKKVMAKPELWEPLIRELDLMYQSPIFAKKEEISAIQAPTLIMSGDHDYYNRADHLLDIFHLLPKGQLSFIPGCGHVVLNCKAGLVIATVGAFLDQPDQ